MKALGFFWVVIVLTVCQTAFIAFDGYQDRKRWKKQIAYKHLVDSTYLEQVKYIDKLELSLDTCANDRLGMAHLPIVVYKKDPIMVQDNIWFEHELNLAENEIEEMDAKLFNLEKELKACKDGN